MNGNNKTSFWLCLFGGCFGLHKFYNKKIGMGILYLFTGGIFFIGWIVDCIKLYRLAFVLTPEQIKEQEQQKAEKRKIREENRQQAIAKRKTERKAEVERIAQLKKQHIPFCPRCGSTSITYCEQRKPFSLGRTIVGGVIAGGAGAVIGGLSSKKVNGHMKCLNCGHTWKI